MKTPVKNHKVALDKNYVQFRADIDYQRRKFERSRYEDFGTYYWWIYFQDFDFSNSW